MSIIYDALKKTQSHRDTTTTSKVGKSQNVWFKVVIIPFFLLISMLMAYIAYQDLMGENPTSIAAVQVTEKPFHLNGVFLADNEKYAMINQQPYKLGDNIGSQRIVGIDLDAVKLRDANKNITTLKIAL